MSSNNNFEELTLLVKSLVVKVDKHIVFFYVCI